MSNKIQNHIADLEGKRDPNPYNAKTDMKVLTRMIVLGPSNSGKSNFIYDWLKRSPNIYSRLVVIARNRDQPIYDRIAEKLGDRVSFYGPEDVPTVDEIGADGGLTCVIIDDFSADAKLQKRVFADYFIRGRHFRITTLFITHSYFAGTDKMIRLNADYIVILKANSDKDLSTVVRDFNVPGVTARNIKAFYEYATRDKGQALVIDNIRSQIRRNYTEILSQ